MNIKLKEKAMGIVDLVNMTLGGKGAKKYVTSAEQQKIK
jgi:hypothetical protein